MKELSDIQLDMLCEMSEIHLKWFNVYSPESKTTFEEVLQLNHIKVMSIIDGCDDCIKQNLGDATLLYYGNYMYGGDYANDEIEKSKKTYRRRKNLDDLT